MTTLTILVTLFSFLVGLCKAVSDTLYHHYYNSIFNTRIFNSSFWNPEFSYLNKYKNRVIDNGEAFTFSTTYLVFLTDAWHLFNAIQDTAIMLLLLTVSFFNISFINAFLIMFLYKLVNRGTFHIFYTHILIIKNNETK
jgi:hypothetical protein